MEHHRTTVKLEETPEPLSGPLHEEREQTRDYKPLKTLPIPLELLVIATRYVNAAHRLSSIIAAGHIPSTGDISEHDVQMEGEAGSGATSTPHQSGGVYADFISMYRRYMLGAIIACEGAVRLGGADVRHDLRARLMLAELLARETHNSEQTEEVIAKAVS